MSYLVLLAAAAITTGGVMYFKYNIEPTKTVQVYQKPKQFYILVPPIVANLVADEPGFFLEIKLVIAVKSEEHANRLHDIIMIIKDRINSVLHGIRLSDLTEPDGLEQLKLQVKHRLEGMHELDDILIANILIDEYKYYQVV